MPIMRRVFVKKACRFCSEKIDHIDYKDLDRIARQTEGHYYLLRFHASTEQIAELERLFRLNEAIVRFMILSEDETAPLQSAAVPTRA